MTYDEELKERRKKDRKEALKNLAKLEEVITILGFNSEFKEDKEHPLGFFDTRVMFRANNPLGEESLLIEIDGYRNKGRVRVSGILPETNNYRTDDINDDVINVSMAKEPAKIAGDIRRRLLPIYQQHLAEALKRLDRHYAYHAARDKVLSTVLGRDITEGERREGKSSFHEGEFGASWGTVTAREEDVFLELRSVPVDTAAKILALLRQG